MRPAVSGAAAASPVPEVEHAEASFSFLPSDLDLEILTELLLEVREHISIAEGALLSLETSPGSREEIHTVFRAFHSIKGSAGSAGLQVIAQLSHSTESLLDAVRQGGVEFRGTAADLALRSVDMLKSLLGAIESELRGHPPRSPNGYGKLMEALAQFDTPGAISTSDAARAPRLGDILVAEGKVTRNQIEEAVARQGNVPLGRALLESKVATLTDVAFALRTQQRLAASFDEASLRVRTEHLDKLLEMVGQLVAAQARILEDPLLLRNAHQDLFQNVLTAGHVIRELQALAISMRMMPLRRSFQRAARIARDTAKSMGKQVNFVTLGEATEIDRRMVEMLDNPLAHMVRNAVDHGIEPPEVREKRGKSSTGTVLLCAHQCGGSLVIELRDDGNGLDPQKLFDRAVDMGLVAAGPVPSVQDSCELLCTPGLSTADKVTQTSGRGVGMDVVKRSIDALGGTLRVSSEPGGGSTFTLRLPLTLATIDGMLACVGPEIFIIPLASIVACLDPAPPASHASGETGDAVTLDGCRMPLVRLHRRFGVVGAVEDPSEGVLVVVQASAQRLALLVDRLLGEQSVIARGRLSAVPGIPGLSGVATLGDGRVGQVLDPDELAAVRSR